MGKRILIIEDDQKTARLVELYLQKDGYRVAVASNGREGLELARWMKPDLAILDLMLPEMDGLEVCRHIRTESDTPIIMLTAKSTENDKLEGLYTGADDYVTKPFSPRELVARVRAVLRRVTVSPEDLADVTADDLTISFARHEVTRAGKRIDLTPTEFSLLGLLVRNPRRVFTRLQLVERIFGFDYTGMERTIDVHVANLRRKIEPDPSRPRYVKTVFGVGYKYDGVDGVQ